MTRKFIVPIMFGLSSLIVAQAASAQPRWGRERAPKHGACFYEHSNFHGNYFCVRQGERLPSLPEGMGDKISSVRVLGDAEATVFRDANLSGRSARLLNDARDLKVEGWGDQISSIEVTNGRDYSAYGGYGRDRGHARGPDGNNRAVDRGWGSRTPSWGRDEQMPREGACFYEDASFRGQYFCVPRGATYTALPRGFNDRISSVRVFGSEVRIFQNANFRGRSTSLRSDTPNLRGNWRDNVSSVRVF